MSQGKQVSQYKIMTETPVSKLIIRLAIPSIISMLINNIYNLVDTAFVGRLGTSASAAVGVVFGFMAIIQAFGFMFGQGSGSILSRALGNRDSESASMHASAGFFGAMLFGLLITIVGFIWLDPIVMGLGSTETIAPYAKTYISYILVAAPFMTGSLALNNVLRYEGKASLGMVGLMSGAILNMIGDPIFMFGLNMGIHGAGLSTALSQIISWIILVFMFLTDRTESKLSIRKAMQASPRVYLTICQTGFPSLVRQGLNSLTTVVLNTQCALYSDAAVAGMSIVSRVIFFAFSISLGIGQGYQPVAGFNYGAKKYSRVKKGFWFTVAAAECVIVVASILILINPEAIIALFRNDPEVIAVGTRALRLQALAYLLFPFSMGVEMLLQSTGKHFGASFLSALRSGLLFIPLLLILSKYRGIAGIQEAQALAITLATPFAVPFLVSFFRSMPPEDGLPLEAE